MSKNFRTRICDSLLPEIFGVVASIITIALIVYIALYFTGYVNKPDYEKFALILVFFYILSILYEMYYGANDR